MKDAFKNIIMMVVSPLCFLLILIMIVYSKLLKLDQKVGERKTVFAILPKFTNYGKVIWLRKVDRVVEYNRDFISWAQYMYYEIKK